MSEGAKTETAKETYDRLSTKRRPYIDRARESAKLTIPSLFPEEGSSGSAEFQTPYQSVGASGINTVSAKILLAVLPAGTAFFKMGIDDYALEELSGDEGARAEIEEALNKVERSIMHEIESSHIRVTAAEGIKHLVLTGNVLLYLPEKGGIRTYRLDTYVVRRDPFGNLLEMITKEEVDREALPEDVRSRLKSEESEKAGGTDKPISVYTRITLQDGKWHSYQEVEGEAVDGTEGTYPKDRCPWIPLRFNKVDGEAYGRGYIEEYIGDLMTLEELTKAISQGSAAAAKILLFVKPNGVTRAKQVQDAPNLSVVTGDAADISVLQLDKYADFRIALELANNIEGRLGRAFMLADSVRRDAERVTAEEIRFVASELDDNLGGLYSILSQELQLPLVKAVSHRMERQKRLPKLPDKVVSPKITAGIDALGRGHDLSKLVALVQHLAPLIQADPSILTDYVVFGDYIKRTGTSLGIDMSGLVRDEKQVEEIRQKRQMEAMMAQMGPSMMPGGDPSAKGPKTPPKEA